MSISNAASQRPDVEGKYERIYANLAGLAERTLSEGGRTPEQTFAALKELLPGGWATLIWLNQQGRPVPEAEQQAYFDRYNAEMIQWHERGVAKVTSRRDWHRREEAQAVESIVSHMLPDTDLVIDLGCGWGHRMFDVWLHGGPKQARYRGGDRSEYSRRIVTAVAQLFPAMDADWFRFDFLAPRLPDVTAARTVCIYSYHAIEQVARLGSGLFDAIVEQFAGAAIRGIHLEPVSSQIPGEDRPDDRAYAASRLYNADLYEQIMAHPKLRLIKSEAAINDIHNGNSTALLVWEYLPSHKR
jgi:hypothetical protein